jgi:periplasmic protein TonB
MFGTLLASNTARLPVTRPAFAAGLLHLIIVIGAIRLTASAPPAAPAAARDTIALQLAPPRDPALTAGGNPQSAPLAPAPVPLTSAPPIPRLDLASPYKDADWHRFVRVESAGRETGAVRPFDSSELRFSTADVDQLPELQGTLSPSYPEKLRRAGISGSVQLEYVILPNGRPDSVSLRVIASTEPAFTSSVIRAVLSASFKPARRRGRPVAMLVQQTIRFQNR